MNRDAIRRGVSKKGRLKNPKRNLRLKRQRGKKPYKIFKVRANTTDVITPTRNRSSQYNFQGGCIDTVAQKSVIGLRQAKEYCKASNIRFNPRRSRSVFRFGDGSFKSLWKLTIRIPTPNNSYITVDSDIVSADVPMLIGLDILYRESLIPHTVLNELQSHIQGWSIPITRKFGHLYITWGENVTLFTK